MKRLKEDFNLALDISKPEDRQAAQKRQKANVLHSAFWKWEQQAFILYTKELHRMEEIQRTVRPSFDRSEQIDAYAAAVQQIPHIEYIVDTFIHGSFEEKLELFRNCRAEVSELEKTRRNRKIEIT